MITTNLSKKGPEGPHEIVLHPLRTFLLNTVGREAPKCVTSRRLIHD